MYIISSEMLSSAKIFSAVQIFAAARGSTPSPSRVFAEDIIAVIPLCVRKLFSSSDIESSIPAISIRMSNDSSSCETA